MTAPCALIALNAGSSSIKFALYRAGGGAPQHIAGGAIEAIGSAPHFAAHSDDGRAVIDYRWPDGPVLSHEDLLGELVEWALAHLGGLRLGGVGHRVVHGGAEFAGAVRIDAAVLARLEALAALAPLHQPHNLAAIRAMQAIVPRVPQVASFDTAYHRGRADEHTRFALPRALHDRGVQRYGFHGLSYAWIAAELARSAPDLARGRVVVAHLGSGASLCAIAAGRSVATTMGFTALDGVMMGTRCGTLDPGLVLHLILREGIDPADLETMLYRQSGLLGVSGIAADMRTLHADGSAPARQAIALFVAHVAQAIAALATTMRGIDTLVFTAGIGEHDALVREAIAAQLEFLGLALDPAANAVGARRISAETSRIACLVIPTDEEAMIAREAAQVLGL